VHLEAVPGGFLISAWCFQVVFIHGEEAYRFLIEWVADELPGEMLCSLLNEHGMHVLGGIVANVCCIRTYVVGHDDSVQDQAEQA
jgi:hypothetical protein